MMSLIPISRCTTPNPETKPRTNGLPANIVSVALLCSIGLSVQSRVHGTTMKNSPASRQYSAKKRGTDIRNDCKGMQNEECRMQNAECRMQNAECRMQK